MPKSATHNIWAIAAFIFLLSGCAGTAKDSLTSPDAKARAHDFVTFLKKQDSSQLSPEEVEGIESLFAGDYQTANDKFNQTVKITPQSSTGHFLNGLTYHLMAKKGESSKFELAEVGYDLAIKYNPTHSHAYYYRGILAFEQQKFDKAQQDFAAALLLRPDDAKIAHGLAVSAYYNHNIEMAVTIIKRALQISPDNRAYMHAAAMIMAAAGEPDDAKSYQEKILKLATSTRQATHLSRRLNEWGSFHKNNLHMASFSALTDDSLTSSFSPIPTGGGSSSAGSSGGTPASGNGAPVESDTVAGSKDSLLDDQMVIVDVVLILTEESNTTKKGLNLLGQLNLTFGNASSNAAYPAGLTFQSGQSYGTLASIGQGQTSTTGLQDFQHMVTQITIPATTYALNAAKSVGDKSEILARPSLLGRHGKTARFFSGQDLTFGFGNNNAVGFKERQVGVFLEITPYVLEDGRVNLKIDLKRDFFTHVDPAVVGNNPGVQTTSTRLESDVVMALGDTLILGGLSDKINTHSENGTMGLKDIPLIGFLFKEVKEHNKYTSVVILVTPRLPQYTYQTYEAISKLAKKKQGSSPTMQRSVEALKARHMDWFKPYTNMASVFYQLQHNQLYKEFRTGDVNLEQWNSMDNVLPQVESAVDFVY